MEEIFILGIVTVLLFLGFVLTLIIGFVRKSRGLKWTALLLFLLSVGLAGWTGYKFVGKSYNKLTGTMKMRSGEEVYQALFGKPNPECVRVLDYQDQVIPVIDYAIWIHFKTCPAELQRIIGLTKFSKEKLSTSGWKTSGPSANQSWFTPEALGDSILVFKNSKDEYGNGQTLYSSLDSSEVFCIDVFD